MTKNDKKYMGALGAAEMILRIKNDLETNNQLTPALKIYLDILYDEQKAYIYQYKLKYSAQNHRVYIKQKAKKENKK